MSIRVNQKVLRLDVSMADSKSMDVGKCFESLICIKFYKNDRHVLLHLVIVLKNSENCLWHVVHNNVEINLIWLVALCIKCMFEGYNIWVLEFFHNLKLSIFVSFVLIHLLDGHLLVILIDCCLENYTE